MLKWYFANGFTVAEAAEARWIWEGIIQLSFLQNGGRKVSLTQSVLSWSQLTIRMYCYQSLSLPEVSIINLISTYTIGSLRHSEVLLFTFIGIVLALCPDSKSELKTLSDHQIGVLLCLVSTSLSRISESFHTEGCMIDRSSHSILCSVVLTPILLYFSGFNFSVEDHIRVFVLSSCLWVIPAMFTESITTFTEVIVSCAVQLFIINESISLTSISGMVLIVAAYWINVSFTISSEYGSDSGDSAPLILTVGGEDDP